MRDFRYWRFWLARHLIHLALWVMPRGRARREVYDLLTVWGLKVTSTVAAQRAATVKRPT